MNKLFSIFKSLFIFLIIPWVINFFVPLLLFPIFSLLPHDAVSTIRLKIINGFLPLVIIGCYYILGKNIEKKIIGETNGVFDKHSVMIFKKTYKENKWELLVYSLASFAFPILVSCMQLLVEKPGARLELNPYLLLDVLLVGPIVEEYLFRAVFTSYCKKKTINQFALLSAVSFTFIHGYSFSVSSIILIIGAFIHTYFLLAALYSYYNCIFVPIQMHILWNAAVLSAGISHPSVPICWLLSSVSLVLIGLSVFRICKKSYGLFVARSAERRDNLQAVRQSIFKKHHG